MSQLIISDVPTFTDVADANFAPDHVLNDVDILAVSHNAKYAAVRPEIIFMGFYKHGDTVPAPVSPVDGYTYSSGEIIFNYQFYSLRAPGAGFVSGQATAPFVSSHQLHNPNSFTAFINSSRVVQLTAWEKGTTNNDGILKVYAICQRDTGSFTIGSVPPYLPFPDDVEASGQPLKTGNASNKYGIVDVSRNAKFATVAKEVFDLGFWKGGSSVYSGGALTSPVDGYVYAAAEGQYKALFYSPGYAKGGFTNGQSTAPTVGGGDLQPRTDKGPLRSWIVDISQAGVITTRIGYYVQGGAENDYYNEGIFRVIAFAQRAAAYNSISNNQEPNYVYTPRSVGGVSGVTGEPTVTELFTQDLVNPGTFRRQCKVNFSVPPVTWETGFTSKAIINTLAVLTTGGSIAGNQTLYVEVCPKISSNEGQASNYLTVEIPAGTSTNKFTFTLVLPSEADGYTVRVGPFPGRCFKQYTGAGSGTFTVTVSSIAALDSSLLSPDPMYDHAVVHYSFDSSPNVIRTLGKTLTPGQTELIFDVIGADSGSTSITVWVQSWNSKNDEYYPFDMCPFATLSLTLDSGTPSGATSLQVLQNKDDSTIPFGFVVFKWNRDTLNYKTIKWIGIYFSAALPGEGPTYAERNGTGGFIVESGTCHVNAGDPNIVVTRASNAAVVNRVLVVYVAGGTPDAEMDGNSIQSQGLNQLAIYPTRTFIFTGDFSYDIIKRFWDMDTPGETTNLWYYPLSIGELDIQSVEDLVWKTKPLPIKFAGDAYATCARRNDFGASGAI